MKTRPSGELHRGRAAHALLVSLTDQEKLSYFYITIKKKENFLQGFIMGTLFTFYFNSTYVFFIYD